MKGKIRNNGDWFIASLCMRNEPGVCDQNDGNARNITWINTHLIRAKSLSAAYEKATTIGKLGNGHDVCRKGNWNWRFVGIWDLVPIYDDIGDGEELYWTDYGRITNRVARRRCITKKQVIKHFTPEGKR